MNGTVYSFTVFASNISGSSPSSTPSNTVTPVDVPETPYNVVATGGNKQATVSWTAPSNNGSPISIYTISVIPAGASATTTGTSILIGNLDNSTSYRFRVVATNAVGDSPPSDLSNIVVPAPTNFTVETEVKSYSNEGQSTTYDIATFNVTSATTSVTSLINWGDGTSSSGEVTLSNLNGVISGTHIYQENGTYTVTVTATTNTGMTTSDIGIIEVFNVDPVVVIEKFTTISQGKLASPKSTFSDVGVVDTHTAEVDWGDGATSTLSIDNSDNSVGGNHLYSNQGDYVITISVTDDDGGKGVATTSLSIIQSNTVVSIPSMPLKTMYLSVVAILLIFCWMLRRQNRI